MLRAIGILHAAHFIALKRTRAIPHMAGLCYIIAILRAAEEDLIVRLIVVPMIHNVAARRFD